MIAKATAGKRKKREENAFESVVPTALRTASTLTSATISPTFAMGISNSFEGY